ncbi:hypothetical protein SOVF_103550 [Spinacia oleracea]|uniref:Uncharacterized protein At4g22758 n=1 Tax=Spinacia oleracea TaxID=3562 RepID=A0ABM3QUR6_SPIOL|nr:uncharacterized protein At4g22758-like [Spinacia oleracea]KNA14860.1 hypothetical protein SOVF_103550 [Spinacia oleracea]
MMHRCTPNYDDHRHAGPRRLTKLLISVTVQGRVGSVQLIMSPENTVGHLIKAVLEVFEKERRRPLLNENHPSCFELHYSPFSLQSLKLEEELINLGSRNFFLCQKPVREYNAGTCFNQTKKIHNFPFSWTNKLMELLL